MADPHRKKHPRLIDLLNGNRNEHTPRARRRKMERALKKFLSQPNNDKEQE